MSVHLVEPASKLFEFEVHVTTSPCGQPLGGVPVDSLISYFEGSFDDITVANQVENLPTATLWKFSVSAKESGAESHFNGEPFGIGDVSLLAFPAPQTILMSLETVDPETVIDPAVLATQGAVTVCLLRVSFKATMTFRPDGLFEAQSQADLGKLVLGESIIKVKGVRYLCVPICAGSSKSGATSQSASSANTPVAPAPAPATVTSTTEKILKIAPKAVSPAPMPPPAPSSLPKPPLTESAPKTAPVLPPAPPAGPPALAPPALAPSALAPSALAPSALAPPVQAGIPAMPFVITALNRYTPRDNLLLESEHSLQAKIAFMPDCAERSILAAIKYFRFACADKRAAVVNPAAALELFETMKRQLFEENLTSTIVTSVLDALAVAIPNGSADECAKLVIQIRNDIAVLDTDFLVELLKQNKEAARRIVGKDVILLLGNTGAGKSTTIHFLGGSEMKMVVDERNGQDCLELVRTLPQLESFLISSHFLPETTHINAIDLSDRITLCDTPSFEGYHSIEMDIANGLSIAEAVRGCRSVRPLYLLSSPSVGDYWDGVEEILKNPIQMMTSVMDALPSFNYWFTKFDLNKYKDNNRIFRNLTYKLESMLENGTPDETMISIFEDMLRKIERRDCIAVNLDPLQDNRDLLLSELMSTPPIENPAEAFRGFISNDQLHTLKGQISKISSAIDNAIARRAYPIVAYRLSQLRTLADCLKLEECINDYNNYVLDMQRIADFPQVASFEVIGTAHD